MCKVLITLNAQCSQAPTVPSNLENITLEKKVLQGFEEMRPEITVQDR